MKRKIVLGIHIGHDRNVALIEDGILIGQLAQERIDRIKHSNSHHIPYQAISRLLDYCRIKIKDINAIGISYTNVIIDNIIEELSSELLEVFDLHEIPILGVSHHTCHAFASFYTSNFNNALVLIADGAGDIIEDKIEAESMYIADRTNIKLLHQRLQDFGLTRTDRKNSFHLDYMHPIDLTKQISLGRKYEQFTYLINFKHDEAGKTMGLASYSKPLFQIPPVKLHGLDFQLNYQEYLTDINEFRIHKGLSWYSFLQSYRAGIASLAQDIIEKYILKILNNVNKTGSFKNLCLAGGVFLNCLLNHKILEKTKFNNIHIVPSSGDDGQAIGAAFFTYKKLYGEIQTSSSTLPYLGPSYINAEIVERLQHFDLQYEFVDNAELSNIIAHSISKGKIVGILRGRSELGPRALCHRSILADPRPKDMKDRLNKIKGRELFRPFAPVVISDEEFKYFELIQSSPYMLLAANTRKEFRKKLAAITHVDNTARIQSVSEDKEPFIYMLLKAFKSVSGFPVLLNTSFNLAGDPIVETPHDAICTFLNSDIDMLVLENYLIIKKV